LRLEARSTLGVVLTFALNACLARHAAAEQPGAAEQPAPAGPQVAVETAAVAPPLVWKWREFSALDYVITATGGALTLTAAIVRPRSQHSLSGGILFDESVRDTLRREKLADRYRFRDASDVGLSLTVTWPFFIDSLVTAWWYRGSRDVAEQMALIDLQALAITGALQGTTNVIVSRERPYGSSCGQGLPEDAHDCEGSTHYRSFFSGHASFSFTGAALICSHHIRNQLLGAPWDALSCAGGYAVAASTATFRIVSDVHYASDVLTGVLVGSLVGYGVPLLHYGFNGGKTESAGLRLELVPAPGGVGVAGAF
jgi:membrane-associated phospholipid phosphatase